MKRNKDLTKNVPNKRIYIRNNGSTASQAVPHGETLTQQQFKEECDVNNIIAKYTQTGSITHVRNAQAGVYADLTNIPDLQEARHIVMRAESAFAEIPAHVRARFGHDPQNMIEFLSKDENREEAIKLGLINKPTPPPPQDPILTELQNLNKNLKPNKKTTTSPST